MEKKFRLNNCSKQNTSTQPDTYNLQNFLEKVKCNPLVTDSYLKAISMDNFFSQKNI